IGQSREFVVTRGMLRRRQKVAGSDREGHRAEARHSPRTFAEALTLRRIPKRLSHGNAEAVQARLDGVVMSTCAKRGIRGACVPGHDDEGQIESAALDELEGLLRIEAGHRVI